MLQSAGAREVRGSVLVLLVAIPLLAMAGWFVHQTVANATVRQQQIRAARVTRTRLVREQLDQETGVRGFTSTHDPVYLKSYYDGQETFANDVVLVRMQLGALPLNDVLALIEEETAIIRRGTAKSSSHSCALDLLRPKRMRCSYAANS